MNYKLEGVMPYKINERKGVQIEKMFDGIALQYDSMNTVLSLGMNMWWRKKALKKLRKYIGMVEASNMEEIDKAIRISLDV